MKLAILQLGLHPMTGAPVPGYLIEADDGSLVLVDTGLGTVAATERAPCRFRVTADDHVVRRLALLGVQPTDVRYLVCSHFDPDHTGAHDCFPQAECVVQRTQYHVGRTGRHSRFEIQRAHWDHPALRYRLIDGDTRLLPGIDLIETGGHVPGHQSVLLQLRETGPTLLAIDAMTTEAQADPATRRPHAFDEDPEHARRSVEKLRAVCRGERVRLIVYGHDPIQWRTLRLAPLWYR